MTREQMAEWLRKEADIPGAYETFHAPTHRKIHMLHEIADELENPILSDPGPRRHDRLFILPDGSSVDLDEVMLVTIRHGDMKNKDGSVTVCLVTGVVIYMKSRSDLSVFYDCDTHEDAKDLARRISEAANNRGGPSPLDPREE